MTTLIALLIWPVALLTFAFAGLLLFLGLLIIPRQQIHYLVRFLCRLILLGAGQILVVDRRDFDDSDGPFIYMFNHASLFDPFIVGSIVRHYITAVGADYQFSYPLWGAMIKRYGIIPIIRTDIRKAIASLHKAEEAIRSGISFLISPEGTRTLNGELGLFKKGGFHVAKNTGATIVPMAFFGTFRAKSKPDWRIRPGVLRAKIGPVITAAEFAQLSVEELRDLVRGRIQDLLAEKVE
ncbi:MAG: lysophospholipid acyltransferase family protein [Candidatus Neomarinimicrobiota bacterium]